MRVLIVMAGFFPGNKYGGPPVSVDNFSSLMSKWDIYIVTKNHDKGEIEPYSSISSGWNTRTNCKVLYLSDSQYNKKNFEQVVVDINPDIIYLQGLFQTCVFPCLQLAKKRNVPVLLAPRGELCSGAFSIKKYKKIVYIEVVRFLGMVNNIHWQSTSMEETEEIMRRMKVNSFYVHRLDNIPSIPRTIYSRENKVCGKGRFVFLSRIHPKKNLLSAIRFLSTAKGDVIFDIYGPIEDKTYWNQCQNEISKLPKNISVNYKGLVNHEHVHEIFSKYDAFLFPTLSENFGHVIAESMMVGTPVIISDQTPWNEVNTSKVSWAVGLDDEEGFKNAIYQIISMDKTDFYLLSKGIKEFVYKKMNLESMYQKYFDCINQIIEENKQEN